MFSVFTLFNWELYDFKNMWEYQKNVICSLNYESIIHPFVGYLTASELIEDTMDIPEYTTR